MGVRSRCWVRCLPSAIASVVLHATLLVVGPVLPAGFHARAPASGTLGAPERTQSIELLATPGPSDALELSGSVADVSDARAATPKAHAPGPVTASGRAPRLARSAPKSAPSAERAVDRGAHVPPTLGKAALRAETATRQGSRSTPAARRERGETSAFDAAPTMAAAATGVAAPLPPQAPSGPLDRAAIAAGSVVEGGARGAAAVSVQARSAPAARSNAPPGGTGVPGGPDPPRTGDGSAGESAGAGRREDTFRAATYERQLAGYLSAARERIRRHRDYPYLARRARLHGSVCLRITLDASGNVARAQPTCPAPPALVRAALRSVSDAAPFGVLPSVLGTRLTFDVPVVFELDEAD